jgi:transposase
VPSGPSWNPPPTIPIKQKTASETFEMSKSAYGEECLSRPSMFEWHERFKEGRESLQDDERKGRPSTSRTEESTGIIQKCSDVRRNDRDQQSDST